MGQVLIRRENRETVNGKRASKHVYVTGPHFNADIYSSTAKASEASRFERAEAERLIALGKWRGSAPIVVPAGGAADLEVNR